ncbi:hypothetical protein EDD86DRAFT_201102 [Gorgonomyces haynaldii]|nr:hypothetical protein EDD86DRAFT_201102 [Gorgonomyces haynaldii]
MNLPPEIILILSQHLSLKDYLTFTSTCRQLQFYRDCYRPVYSTSVEDDFVKCVLNDQQMGLSILKSGRVQMIEHFDRKRFEFENKLFEKDPTLYESLDALKSVCWVSLDPVQFCLVNQASQLLNLLIQNGFKSHEDVLLILARRHDFDLKPHL